ncbi:hypothetical protein M434DRAFT_212365 [Hypoxylon sp. CO27-5]|nr:hypothetical protein M434DRAFT_212365 [Hypoxylon sp. CO27-5]
MNLAAHTQPFEGAHRCNSIKQALSKILLLAPILFLPNPVIIVLCHGICEGLNGGKNPFLRFHVLHQGGNPWLICNAPSGN